MLSTDGEKVTVSPFSKAYKPLTDIPIGQCATAFTDPESGSTIILIFNESLYFGSNLENSLICPNQLRFNDIKVYDCPRQFDARSLHRIEANDLIIPLSLDGVVSYFETRPPTDDKLEN